MSDELDITLLAAQDAVIQETLAVAAELEADKRALQVRISELEAERDAWQREAQERMGDFGEIVVVLAEILDPKDLKPNAKRIIEDVRALRAESAGLRELVQHMQLHSGYSQNGRKHMTTPQKELYDSLDCAALRGDQANQEQPRAGA